MPKRTDTNHGEIIKGLRSVGFSAFSTAPLGDGFPDVAVGGLVPCPHCQRKFPQNLLLEVKDGSKSPSRRRLTDDEEDFHKTWRGQVQIVSSLDDALKTIGASQD